MEKKEETITQYHFLSDILKRTKLGGKNSTENKFDETKQTFYRPSGEVVEISIKEAATEFMYENYPTFGEKSLSFPEQAVDYGLPTQALLLTKAEQDKVANCLDPCEKDKFKEFMKTKVEKGAVSEIEVFKFANKSEDKLLMATFWSFNQSCLQKLIPTEELKNNQEMDVIIILAKQRKFIIIEVKSDQSGNVPSKALKTLKSAETFAHQVFNILGVQESENWEYIPLVALPNVASRDKLKQSQQDHILTKTELESDLSKVFQLNEDEYEDVSTYKKLLSFLAASYHATSVKKGSMGGVQFEFKNLVLEASYKLAGKAQIQAGFDVSDEVKDPVSFTDLQYEPLAGFRGFMFWNKQQIDLLKVMEEHGKHGTPCVIAGVYGTGKTLLLAYKAIKLSKENKKVVFISNLDWTENKVDTRHYVFEEKMRIDLLDFNSNILFYTMKDIINDLKKGTQGFGAVKVFSSSLFGALLCTRKYSILLQFIRNLIRTGTYHILIDEVEYSPSLLEELQEVRLNKCSLTVALRGKSALGKLTLEKQISVLKKIMRMSTQIYKTVTNPEDIPDSEYFQDFKLNLYENSTAQHTVLGCKPEGIHISSRDELISTGLEKALPKVTSHPFVVVLIDEELCPHYPYGDVSENVVRAAKVIKTNTKKQVLAFTGATSELEELRALLRNPSGFLVTTAGLYSGMEATSVIAIQPHRGYYPPWGLNGLTRATTSLIYIYSYS